jgi:NMD protein affecting ribosome stability and mRNA decay
MVKCLNCGINDVREEGDWCWECIRDRESLD